MKATLTKSSTRASYNLILCREKVTDVYRNNQLKKERLIVSLIVSSQLNRS